MRDDIYKLKLSYSSFNFKINYQLFRKKWSYYNSKKEIEFLDYFNNEWIESSNNGWFEGIANHVPSTNSALESVNNTIKKIHTKRTRFTLGHFLTK